MYIFFFFKSFPIPNFRLLIQCMSGVITERVCYNRATQNYLQKTVSKMDNIQILDQGNSLGRGQIPFN